MKKSVVVLILIFISGGIFAQKAGILTFAKEEHDFGTIKEADGKKSYTFEFMNTGNAPLIITNVEPSCGCTSPEWTKKPVLPGEKGFIVITYDPKNRPGKFEKSIAVSSNAANHMVTLIISGEVIPLNIEK